MNSYQLSFLQAILKASSQEEADYIIYDVMPNDYTLSIEEYNEVLQAIDIEPGLRTFQEAIAHINKAIDILRRLREDDPGRTIFELEDLSEELSREIKKGRS